MRKIINVFNTINARILVILLVMLIIATGIVSVLNNYNIRRLSENSYTERLLLTNALMGTLIHTEDIEYFIDLMKNQDSEFKRLQVDFYHDREEFLRLRREGAGQEEQLLFLNRMTTFYDEMSAIKDEAYWTATDALKKLKELSGSTYVYVMADTGLRTRYGEKLYTYIFDAEDEVENNNPDTNGLGTSDIGNNAFENVFITKIQTESAEYYEGDLGKLYIAYVPILNESGDVIAILGTDLSLGDMNSTISFSSILFNSLIAAVFVVSVIIVFIMLRRGIAKPISSLTETALAFAEGDLHTQISEMALKRRTEIGTLAHAIQITLDATALYLNNVPECLFIMNRNCDTYFRNEQFIRRFGDMLAPEFISALFPVDTRDSLEKCLLQENNNTIIWISDSCFAVMLKEVTLNNMPENSILVIANDITDLVKEKESAQATAAAKSSFLSRMSDEMRAPMNAIIGMAKVAENSDDIYNIKRCISTIRTSSEQLTGIINDVLDMSKIEAGKLELVNAPMNIEITLIRVCNLFTDSMEKKKLNFSVSLSKDMKLHYIADDLRLSQVLTNLLSNAVKFTHESGTIALTVEDIGRDGNKAILRFSVADTGIGLTSSQIARLFNVFEKADDSIARRSGGTGFGLAISQSIIEKMGGHIEVESSPGAGATFSFTVAFECVLHQDAIMNEVSGNDPDSPGENTYEETMDSDILDGQITIGEITGAHETMPD